MLAPVGSGTGYIAYDNHRRGGRSPPDRVEMGVEVREGRVEVWLDDTEVFGASDGSGPAVNA
jgi:hypothetical protein